MYKTKTTDYHVPLMPDQFYHLFNRAVGNEKLFLSDENYNYFLDRLNFHTSSVADIFVYALLPNHFHLLVKIKTKRELLLNYKLKKGKAFNNSKDTLSHFVMQQFSNWLNGYAKAFNKMYHRKGSLFIDYLKRSQAKSDDDISAFIFYIHKNAVHHGLTQKIGDWLHDSYQVILSNNSTFLKRNEVIDWFGSVQRLIDFHKQPVGLKQIGKN